MELLTGRIADKRLSLIERVKLEGITWSPSSGYHGLSSEEFVEVNRMLSVETRREEEALDALRRRLFPREYGP